MAASAIFEISRTAITLLFRTDSQYACYTSEMEFTILDIQLLYINNQSFIYTRNQAFTHHFEDLAVIVSNMFRTRIVRDTVLVTG